MLSLKIWISEWDKNRGKFENWRFLQFFPSPSPLIFLVDFLPTLNCYYPNIKILGADTLMDKREIGFFLDFLKKQSRRISSSPFSSFLRWARKKEEKSLGQLEMRALLPLPPFFSPPEESNCKSVVKVGIVSVCRESRLEGKGWTGFFDKAFRKFFLFFSPNFSKGLNDYLCRFEACTVYLFLKDNRPWQSMKDALHVVSSSR